MVGNVINEYEKHRQDAEFVGLAGHPVVLGNASRKSSPSSPQRAHTNKLIHTVILKSRIGKFKKIRSGYIRNLLRSTCLGEYCSCDLVIIFTDPLWILRKTPAFLI